MPDVTQPTSEALSDDELKRVRRQMGDSTMPAFYGLDGYTSRRLLATLDQALARCGRAERRVEELEDFHADYLGSCAHDRDCEEEGEGDCCLEGWHQVYKHAMRVAAQPEPDTPPAGQTGGEG